MEEYIRDYIFAAAIFGFFTFAWFGWAQERPRKSWRVPLGVMSTLGLLLSIFSFYIGYSHWDSPSALNTHSSFNAYITFVIIEFLVALIVGVILIIKKWSNYVAPWIALVVGVHFFPLSFVFDDFIYNILGVLVVITALLAVPLARKLDVASSAVTGIGTGTFLFIFAVINLIRFYTGQ